ncbi:HipA family kinase [Anoxybacillus sp. ST4]|uniref:HipA family kinase n=1 Tax=Anoxybacillus sp. ST4 TaxID=2864181 RepID=UPI001C63EF44|nr:HipA family kinase [Anoxybacillus sp. ST4]MBW7651548.1 hypothetical protein [Anoxybacillus sp. ST4]
MLRRIEVDAFLKELGDDKKGMSRPIMVIGEDGKTYVLKNQNVYNPHTQKWEVWSAMFLQEALVYNIAKYLDIHIPDCVAANIDRDFLENAPALNFQYRYSPGLHFASKYIDGSENNLKNGYEQLVRMKKPYIKVPWTNFFKKIVNSDEIPKIIAMDILTANFDRFSNDGNILIAKVDGQRKVFVIDHGHCFGNPYWNINKRQFLLKASPDRNYVSYIIDTYARLNGGSPFVGMGIIFRALDQHINVSDPNNHSFMDVVYKIENITPTMIDEWFKGIPDEWFVEKQNQIAAYKQFLMKQKDIVRIIINELHRMGAFQHYTGGELSWIDKKTGTQ